MEFTVYNKEGKLTGETLTLEEVNFNITPHEHSMYLAVKSEMKNSRQGTHSTKTRSEKRGGGKKPFSQKGRGVARAGSSRSPLWVGGGVIFGPKPHSYNSKVNKKVKKLARKSALSFKLQSENIRVIENFDFSDHKSKNIRNLLTEMKLDTKKVLFLTSDKVDNLSIATRNFYKVHLSVADHASTYKIMNSDVVLIDKIGLENLNNCLKD